MRQIFLHIGYGKCGTTAIQKFAYDNFKDNNKIYLPKTGWWKEGEGHHHLANNLNYNVNEAAFSKKWKDVAEELKFSIAETGFISSEQFCFLKPPQIKSIHNVLSQYGWKIKIIFFVRSQLELALSSYMQKLKHSTYTDVGDFEVFFNLHKNSFDFQYRIDIWENLFGFENLIVKLYDKKLFGNVIEVLCKILNISLDDYLVKQSESTFINHSIVPEFIDLIQFFDKNYPNDHQQRQLFISHLIKLSKVMNNYSSGIKMFGKEESKIIEYFKRKNEDFGNKFFTTAEKKALNEKFFISEEDTT